MPSQDPWTRCPPGELSDLQDALKEQSLRVRRRRRFLMAGGAMSLAAIGVGASLIMLSKDGSIAILSCEETMDMLPAYADGSLVAVADRKAVEKHLKHCPGCRRKYENTY